MQYSGDTIKQTLKSESRLSVFLATVGGAALLLAIAQLASRALAIVRDRLLATGFGTSQDLDVYYAAFRVPDFIYQVLILGAISAAFIPVFAGYLANKQTDEANRVGSAIISLGLAALVFVCGIVWIFTPQLVHVIAPGFDAGQLEKLTDMTRIMLLSPIFFGLSGIFGSILNAHHRFVAYAIAPLCYNLGIIAGALVAPKHGLAWLAIGVVVGALLQMLIQFGGVLRTGFKFRPSFSLQHPGVRRILLLMIPTTIGLAIVQVNWLVETIIATTLRTGSLSQFWLASTLAMVPVGVVGASYAVAVFPILAKAASTKQPEVFTLNLISAIRHILYLIIPASFAMLLLRAQIVRLVYGAGKFDFTATRYVVSLLGILVVSLFAQALIPLMTRAFYALRNTKTPVVISAFSMLLNIVLALVLSHYLGVVGLAAAFSAASIVQVALLFFFLSAKVPRLEDASMISAIFKIIFATVVMGLGIYTTLYLVAYLAQDLANQFTVLYFVLQTIAALAVGLAIYLFVTDRMGLPEARMFKNKLAFLRRR